MPKSERDDAVSALAARILRAMIDDFALDAALQSHQEIARSRAVCNICHTRCQAVHVPGPSNIAAAPSRADTPLSSDAKLTAETETSTPNCNNGTNYLECVNCNRQVAPSRYAPHLSACMGLATARRGARANANIKSKQNSETLRSDSPASEAGTMSDDKPAAKGKAKAKTKAKGPLSCARSELPHLGTAKDEAEFNLKRKRLESPQTSPNKRPKKSRPPANGSPVSRVLAEADSVVPSSARYSPSTNSHSKVPSKLRESSTTSFRERSATPTSSRSSSPDGVSATTPASSSFSQSPNIAARVIGNGKSIRGRASGIGPPKRPTPPPIHVPDYSMVDGGDETGSSTDTDSA
ncbi:hypothetical protein APHAL10511_006532 [Amanita phalloides]|nr:hypothetical protein APHAL10511_006532 [Amanita phalloides]